MREIHHLALMEGDILLTADGDAVGKAALVTTSGDVTRVAFATGIEASFAGDTRVFIADLDDGFPIEGVEASDA